MAREKNEDVEWSLQYCCLQSYQHCLCFEYTCFSFFHYFRENNYYHNNYYYHNNNYYHTINYVLKTNSHANSYQVNYM